MNYWDIFTDSWTAYARYLHWDVTHPGVRSYFFWLFAISTAVYVLELVHPWRKDQPRIRRDFWLDAFYMLFNFFLFSLIVYQAASDVVVRAFNDALAGIGITNLVALEVSSWPVWVQLLTLFVLRDFIHWNVHRLLHHVPWLWEFHKVHHSVLQMGFAAHLRFHWMETVVYRTLEYVPLALIGFGIDDFLIVHLTALTIGHLNHANVYLPLGPFKYVFNNPQMHIWHHMKHVPKHRTPGVNYGLSLSFWDYVFGTAYVPRNGRDIELGFEDVERFPRTFLGQVAYPAARPRGAGGAAAVSGARRR
jgi:sterol desaturase/sphingolipid hydroxylase (fatty acid hydroxylase superfamily)